MNFVNLTVKSNFIDAKSVRAFHAAMYHGESGRGGKSFPSDSPPSWDSPSEPLELSLNTRSESKFFVPGYYPVVSLDIYRFLEEDPCVRAGSVEVVSCIDLPWAIGEGPPREGDDEYSYFKDGDYSVACPTWVRLIELIMRQVSPSFSGPTAGIVTETGTPPLAKSASFDVPVEWIDNGYSFAVGVTYFFSREVFDSFAEFVPSEFFLIRNCQA